jgi:hypothetical protein
MRLQVLVPAIACVIVVATLNESLYAQACQDPSLSVSAGQVSPSGDVGVTVNYAFPGRDCEDPLRDPYRCSYSLYLVEGQVATLVADLRVQLPWGLDEGD